MRSRSLKTRTKKMELLNKRLEEIKTDLPTRALKAVDLACEKRGFELANSSCLKRVGIRP